MERKKAKRNHGSGFLRAPKISPNQEKDIQKIGVFADPLLGPTLPHFRLLQVPEKHPK